MHESGEKETVPFSGRLVRLHEGMSLLEDERRRSRARCEWQTHRISRDRC